MKVVKLLSFIIPLLVSCAAPARQQPRSTSTPAPSKNALLTASAMPIASQATARPVNVEGRISWLLAGRSTKVPITTVNLELLGHSGSYPRYTASTDADGHYQFANVEPNEYGIGVYFNLPVGKRLCEAPEYEFNQDLGWLHYATALRGEIWHDILFSSEDISASPGQTVFVDFVLKCP